MKLKLTSKRQATFPARVCEEMGLQPGDHLILEKVTGTDGWLLRKDESTEDPAPWFGSLRSYARGKATSMTAIRASIAKGRNSARGA